MCSTYLSRFSSRRRNHESIGRPSQRRGRGLRFGGLLRFGQAFEILLDKRSVALRALLAHALEQILTDTRRQLEENRSRRRVELRQLARGAGADRATVEVALRRAHRWRPLALLGLPVGRSLTHPAGHAQRLLHPPGLQHLSQGRQRLITLALLPLPALAPLASLPGVGLHRPLQPLHHPLERLLVRREGPLGRVEVALVIRLARRQVVTAGGRVPVAGTALDGTLLALEALVRHWLLAAQRGHELVLVIVIVFLVALLTAGILRAALRVCFATGQRLVGVILPGRDLLLLAVGRVRRLGELRRTTLGLPLLTG